MFTLQGIYFWNPLSASEASIEDIYQKNPLPGGCKDIVIIIILDMMDKHILVVFFIRFIIFCPLQHIWWIVQTVMEPTIQTTKITTKTETAMLSLEDDGADSLELEDCLSRVV